MQMAQVKNIANLIAENFSIKYPDEIPYTLPKELPTNPWNILFIYTTISGSLSTSLHYGSKLQPSQSLKNNNEKYVLRKEGESGFAGVEDCMDSSIRPLEYFV